MCIYRYIPTVSLYNLSTKFLIIRCKWVLLRNPLTTRIVTLFEMFSCSQWIDLRENLQENPLLNGKIYGFL